MAAQRRSRRSRPALVDRANTNTNASANAGDDEDLSDETGGFVGGETDEGDETDDEGDDGTGVFGADLGADALSELRDPVDQWIRDSLADPPLAWRLGDDGIGMLTGAGAVLLVALVVIWWLWRQHAQRTAAQLRAAQMVAQPPTPAYTPPVNADALTAARVGEPTIAQEDASAALYHTRGMHPALAGVKAAAAAVLSHVPDMPSLADAGASAELLDGSDLATWDGAY